MLHFAKSSQAIWVVKRHSLENSHQMTGGGSGRGAGGGGSGHGAGGGRGIKVSGLSIKAVTATLMNECT